MVLDFNNPDKLLDFLLSKNVEYQVILEISQELLPLIKAAHKKIGGQIYPSAITQCILECFKIKNNFKSSIWQSSRFLKDEDIKKTSSPIKFSRIIASNEVANYEMYNSDQLNIDTLNLEKNSDFNQNPKSKENKEEKEEERKEENKEEKGHLTNLEVKKIILSYIKEFDNQYGKSGVSKILKGSQSVKDNDYNSDSVNSSYFGILKNHTLKFINNEIDKLLKEKLLIIKKINFARPILCINPQYKDEIEKIINKKNDIQKNNKENSSDDENVIKILNLINQGRNIFITGHAGSGKSYILNKLKEKIKNLVLTSTTGIAAVNVKGQTIHSFCGVGLCNRPIKMTVDKILSNRTLEKQIKKCQILALDEVSMLSIDTFEYIDSVLKIVRDNLKPFGGMQVIFIGDFFQLPPVKTKNQAEIKYCFESKLWNDFNFYTIQLTKNYRQNEQALIDALSHMRINKLNNEDIELFKKRECKKSEDLDDILHIFATNSEAEEYNNLKFKNINSKEYKLSAIDGICKGENFMQNPKNDKEINILNRIDTLCRAEKNISLKINARVMLLVNLDFEKGLINGSCGNVLKIEDDYILIKFDNNITQKIERHDFEFYHNEILIAKRVQFPLRLAWGITIHKSQGMSLDKLVVDCSRIFEKGQVYVALSRIRTLEGLYLHNFSADKVMTDEKVVEFYKTLKSD